MELKRHGAWKSSSVAEGYIEDIVSKIRSKHPKKISIGGDQSVSKVFNVEILVSVDDTVSTESESNDNNSNSFEINSVENVSYENKIVKEIGTHFHNITNSTINIFVNKP